MPLKHQSTATTTTAARFHARSESFPDQSPFQSLAAPFPETSITSLEPRKNQKGKSTYLLIALRGVLKVQSMRIKLSVDRKGKE